MNIIKQNSEIFDDNFLKFDLEIDYENNLKKEPNVIKEEGPKEIKEEEPTTIKEEEDSKNNINNEIICKPKRILPEK